MATKELLYKLLERVARLQVNDATVAPDIRELHGRLCEIKNTTGDGACAIHSVFGIPRRDNGFFFKSGAREFLRQAVGDTSSVFRDRLGNGRLLRSLEQVLWKELVKPSATLCAGLPFEHGVPSLESQKLWSCITNESPVIRLRCIQHSFAWGRTSRAISYVYDHLLH